MPLFFPLLHWLHSKKSNALQQMFKAFCSWNHTRLQEETFHKCSINPDGNSTNILQMDVTRDLFIFIWDMLEKTGAAVNDLQCCLPEQDAVLSSNVHNAVTEKRYFLWIYTLPWNYKNVDVRLMKHNNCTVSSLLFTTEDQCLRENNGLSGLHYIWNLNRYYVVVIWRSLHVK